MKIWTEEEIKEFESLRTKKQKLPVIHKFCKDHDIMCKDGNYIFTINMKKYLVTDQNYKPSGFIVIKRRYDRIIRLWHELFFQPINNLKEKRNDNV